MPDDLPSDKERLARAISRPASMTEIAIVLGIPSALSLVSAFRINGQPEGAPAVTDLNALLSVGLQVILAAFLLFYLRRRNWRPMEIAGEPEPRDILLGVAVWIAVITAFYFVLLLLTVLDRAFMSTIQRPLSGHISPPAILAVAVIDPVFEEFLWLGYTIPAVANRAGLRIAFVVSVFFRVLAHAYQGKLALIAILPVALVLTWYFVRTGRLWPVIVAHIVQDAIALSVLRAPS